ncbi:MAG: 4,5-DOPA dioxygenase extradiol [Saprospiraceae bacterium]|nr:4,5-DOPA dioxygenase extradiol [Saprospiraceae bacterium]
MKRKEFIQMASVLPLAFGLTSLHKWYSDVPTAEESPLMPVLFIGHGSPMNGIEDNPISKSWKNLGETIPQPGMVLVVSAHWLTKGSHVTAMEKPRTIYDFGGFPDELYQVKYPAPGSPKMADEVKNAITTTPVGLDHEWGLDHGTWTIVRHMYPNADIPVLQLSIDYGRDATYHFRLAAELGALRKRGVLIIGSGNAVHNLSKIAFGSKPDFGYDWAIQANEEMKSFILDGNYKEMLTYQNKGSHWQLAIPSPDHYYPLMYTLGLTKPGEKVEVFNDTPTLGSIAMTSYKFG